MGVGFCGDVITGLRVNHLIAQETDDLQGTAERCVKDSQRLPLWYAGAQEKQSEGRPADDFPSV
jgi:hypothetical protein